MVKRRGTVELTLGEDTQSKPTSAPKTTDQNKKCRFQTINQAEALNKDKQNALVKHQPPPPNTRDTHLSKGKDVELRVQIQAGQPNANDDVVLEQLKAIDPGFNDP